MLSARAEKGFTQPDVASMAGVSVNLISCLERLIFPASYRYEEAISIADILEISPEHIMPEKMIGWKGPTKFMTVAEVPLEVLLEYKERAESHYLLSSPDEAIEEKDDFARVKSMVARLPERYKLIINLRYGFDKELGGPYTDEEIGKRLHMTAANVSYYAQKAIGELQDMAGNDLIMSNINAVSLDKIEEEEEEDDNLDEMACGKVLMNEITAKPLEKVERKGDLR
jgi:RNA polymerase sigma factor (sigma-70 family)